MSELLQLPSCDCYKVANQVCDVCQIWRPTLYRLQAELAECQRELADLESAMGMALYIDKIRQQTVEEIIKIIEAEEYELTEHDDALTYHERKVIAAIRQKFSKEVSYDKQ